MRAEHFDAVVVGSGFGGSVMAYRLAEAGLRVCLLERGKAYPPGSFPRSPYRMRENFWDPDEGLHGLYDFWSFHRIHALVASGLGGGSLIYANVLLRKDEEWFVKEDLQRGGYEHWPLTRAELDPHYDAAEEMMRPHRYPIDQTPYSGTSKTRAFGEAARRLGLEPFLPNLAVTFANEGEALYHFFTPWLNVSRIIGLLPMAYAAWWKRSIYVNMAVHVLGNAIPMLFLLAGLLGAGAS